MSYNKEPIPECKYCTGEAWETCAKCKKPICILHIGDEGYSFYFDTEFVICKGCKNK